MDEEEQKAVPTRPMAFLMLSRDRLYMVSDNIYVTFSVKKEKKHAIERRKINFKNQNQPDSLCISSNGGCNCQCPSQ